MHIFQAMFSKGLGGIEQSFVDHAIALADKYDVACVIRRGAAIKALIPHSIPVYEVGASLFGLRSRISKLIKQVKPDLVFAHGGRAADLFQGSSEVPVIGVAHNYRYSRLLNCNAIIAVTKDLRESIIQADYPEKKVTYIPNMVAIPVAQKKEKRKIPVIGFLGRFVPEKGLPILLAALHELKIRGVAFQAELAGEGPELEKLKQLIRSFSLEQHVVLSGWVKEKQAFFNSINVFCLPSMEETFGIVLLEAFAHSTPVVTSDAKGPCQIAEHKKDALIVPKGDAVLLADALQTLISDQKLQKSLAAEAYKKVIEYYSANIVSQRLKDFCETYSSKN